LLRTLLPFDDLANSSETTLTRLGFRFYKHKSRTTVEFEVFDPAEFLVRIENLSGDGFRPEPFFGLLGGAGEGNAFSVVVTSGHSLTKPHVSSFVTELVSALPKKPWEGLGFVSGRTSKAYWLGLMQV
jgi:hypothetical protein